MFKKWLPEILVPALLLFVLGSVAADDRSIPSGNSAETLQAALATSRHTGPWDMTRLKQTPAFTWGESQDAVREVYYDGESYRGKPTRVFAYYARPQQGDGPFPAMVLVHGGGGEAFAEWAALWAKRGYAALAMDLAGCGPERKRLADGGPDQRHEDKFPDFTDETVHDVWTYQAVAAVIRGHSLLASFPEVDADRIGITGISWGGYLTCIVSGVDDRLKVAVPVYGCGFLHENSAWLPIFGKMTPELRDRWVHYFDPSQYLPGVSCPILFVNGTNDFAYPLDSYQKSYRAVQRPRELCITVRMPHGHQVGWAPAEIGLFVDSVLTCGTPLPRLGTATVAKDEISAVLKTETKIQAAQLHTTTDNGVWKERNWITLEASFDENKVRAELPAKRPLVAFLTVRDDRGATVSTEHVVIGKSK